jgi:hypothetical protein
VIEPLSPVPSCPLPSRSRSRLDTPLLLKSEFACVASHMFQICATMIKITQTIARADRGDPGFQLPTKTITTYTAGGIDNENGAAIGTILFFSIVGVAVVAACLLFLSLRQLHNKYEAEKAKALDKKGEDYHEKLGELLPPMARSRLMGASAPKRSTKKRRSSASQRDLDDDRARSAQEEHPLSKAAPSARVPEVTRCSRHTYSAAQRKLNEIVAGSTSAPSFVDNEAVAAKMAMAPADAQESCSSSRQQGERRRSHLESGGVLATPIHPDASLPSDGSGEFTAVEAPPSARVRPSKVHEAPSIKHDDLPPGENASHWSEQLSNRFSEASRRLSVSAAKLFAVEEGTIPEEPPRGETADVEAALCNGHIDAQPVRINGADGFDGSSPTMTVPATDYQEAQDTTSADAAPIDPGAVRVESVAVPETPPPPPQSPPPPLAPLQTPPHASLPPPAAPTPILPPQPLLEDRDNRHKKRASVAI